MIGAQLLHHFLAESSVDSAPKVRLGIFDDISLLHAKINPSQEKEEGRYEILWGIVGPEEAVEGGRSYH